MEHTYGGGYTRWDLHKEGTSIRKDVYTKGIYIEVQICGKIHTRRDHTYGGRHAGIYTVVYTNDGTYTRRGTCTLRRCTWRSKHTEGHTHWGTHSQNIRLKEQIYGETHTRRGHIYTEGTYTWRNKCTSSYLVLNLAKRQGRMYMYIRRGHTHEWMNARQGLEGRIDCTEFAWI